MNIDDAHAQRRGRARRAGHGVGNVVQFQIQEERQAQIFKGPHAVRTMGAEKLQPQLQAADMAAQAFRQLKGVIEIGGV